MLTRQQMTENIEAMEKQGATQQEIQEWLDSQKTSPTPTSTPAPTEQQTEKAGSGIFTRMAPPPEPEKKPWWAKAGSFATDVLAGGSKKFGETLGTAGAAAGASKDIGAANVAEAESQLKLAELLKDPNTTEEQKRNIRSQLGQGIQVPTAGEQIPTLNKTGRQVAGEGLETFVDIASAGQYKGMDKVLKSAPSLSKYLKLGAQGAAIGGSAGLAKAMQDNEPDWKQGVKDVGYGLALGGLAGAAIPAVIDGAAAGWKKLYSTMSGVPKEAVDQLVDNPDATMKAVRATSADRPKAQKDIADSFDDAVNTLTKDRSDSYKKSLEEIKDRTVVSAVDPNISPLGADKDAISARLTKKADEYARKIENVKKQFEGKFHESDYKWKIDPLIERENFYRKNAKLAVTDPSKAAMADPDASIWWKNDNGAWDKTKLSVKGVKSAMTKTLKELGFERVDDTWEIGKSSMKKEHLGDINELIGRIETWDDFTPKGMNDLRKVVGSYEGGAEEKAYNIVIGKMKSSLANHIDDNAPEVISSMNRNYATASEEIRNIVQEIGKESGSTQAKANKIIELYNPKSAYRKQLVERLGEKTANDILEQVNIYLLSEWGPRGLLRRITEGAGVAGGLATGAVVGPKAALLAPAAVAASPRLGAEVTAATTKAARSSAAKTAGNMLRQETAKKLGD